MKKNIVCYCFGYSEEEIIRDVRENGGTSLILKRISDEKRNGTCNCRYNHPEDR
ncbi:MAG: hypothetical protein HZB33_09495 [Nitrospirae bacterium]|nr:hypothetical protein [Nitrospirota bacterium]